jgi:hypothetical protein
MPVLGAVLVPIFHPSIRPISPVPNAIRRVFPLMSPQFGRWEETVMLCRVTKCLRKCLNLMIAILPRSLLLHNWRFIILKIAIVGIVVWVEGFSSSPVIRPWTEGK